MIESFSELNLYFNIDTPFPYKTSLIEIYGEHCGSYYPCADLVQIEIDSNKTLIHLIYLLPWYSN